MSAVAQATRSVNPKSMEGALPISSRYLLVRSPLIVWFEDLTDQCSLRWLEVLTETTWHGGRSCIFRYISMAWTVRSEP